MSDTLAPVAANDVPPLKLSVADRLRATKAARAGEDTLTLPESGVAATIPRFKPYDAWAKAQRLGGKDQSAVMVYFITSLVRFDGDRLTAGDYRDLISAADHIALLGALYGGEDGAAKDGEAADEGVAGK